MNIRPFHHQYPQNDWFGLWPTRLVYAGAETPKGVEVKKTVTLAELERETKEAQDKVKENKSKLTESIIGYNTNSDYVTEEYFTNYSETERTRRPQEQPLRLDFSKLGDKFDPKTGEGGIISQIEQMLASEFYYDGRTYDFSRVGKVFSGRGKQVKELEALLAHLKSHQKLEEKLQQALHNELRMHEWLLVRKDRRVEEMSEIKKGFENQDAYQDLGGDYDEAVTGWLSDTEFREFYERPDGSMDPYRERENKNLFMAILSYETTNWEEKDPKKRKAFLTDFVLSRFTENSEENKRNYPFIHHEWVAKRGEVDRSISAAEREVTAKEKELKARKAPTVADIVADLKAYVDEETALAEKFGEVTFENPLDKVDREVAVKDSEQYRLEIEKLEEFRSDLALLKGKTSLDNPAEKAFATYLRDTIEEKINPRLELMEAYKKLKQREESAKGLEEEFTRENLSKPVNRQIVVELAMRKFKKAMLMIDRPFGKGGGTLHRNFHPGVRRMLIATAYYEGVSRYTADGEYVENTANEYKWLLSKMTQSKYFNQGVRDRYLEAEQRNFIIIARYANLALFNAKHLRTETIPALKSPKMQERIERLQKNLRLHGEARKAAQDAIDTDMAVLRRYNTALTEQNVLDDEVVKIEERRLVAWQAFSARAEKLMLRPDREEIKKYIAELRGSDAAKGANESTRKKIDAFAKYAETVDLNFNTLEHNEHERYKYLEKLDIDVDGVYKSFRLYLKTHPDMTTDQWENLLQSKEGVAELKKMFDQILAPKPGKTVQGKKSFLKILDTLHGFNLKTHPDIRDGQAVVFNIVSMLKMEIDEAELLAGVREEKEAELQAKMEGMTFGDKITDYGRGVVDMVLHGSLSQKAAGVAILIAAWKMARSAVEGKTATGKGLQILALVAAAELTLKHVTGEGVLDRLRWSGLAEDLGGTYEAVLIERAEVKGMDMSPQEHAAGLMQMRTVPFHKLMEWYEKSGVNGMPREGQRDKFPKGIDIYTIVQGRKWKEENKEMRARKVIKQIMRNFFGYVGNKDQRDEYYGKDIMKEIYVTAVHNKSFKPEASKADRHMPKIMLEEFRRNPRLLTWEQVMASEIRTADVKKTAESKTLEQIKQKAVAAGNWIARWTRQEAIQWGDATAKEFWGNVSENYAPRVEEWLGRMKEAGAEKLTYAARHIELSYKGKYKFILRQIGRETWDLAILGAELPFHLAYGAHQLIVPWASCKLRQMYEIMRSDRLQILDGPLQSADIVNGADFVAIQQELIRKGKPADFPSVLAASFDASKNPGFRHFGLYQIPFNKAFREGEREGKDRYYISGKAPREQKHIGYYISETTPTDAKVKPTDSVSGRLNAMRSKGYEQAKQFYMTKHPDLTEEDISKMMFPIHAMAQTADKTGKTPQRLYMFWRMPLPNSSEYLMKHHGTWTDYMDPNKHKHRPPFKVDPSLGILDNLKRAFYNPYLAKGITYAKIATAQFIRSIFGAVETIGDVAGAVHRGFQEKGEEGKDQGWLYDLAYADEETLQSIDEYMGTAAYPGLALSDFYKNKINSRLYEQAVEKVRDNPTGATLEDELDKITKWRTVRVERWDDVAKEKLEKPYTRGYPALQGGKKKKK